MIDRFIKLNYNRGVIHLELGHNLQRADDSGSSGDEDGSSGIVGNGAKILAGRGSKSHGAVSSGGA